MFQKKITYQESNFMALDDLVYAPLQALAESNHQLREQVIEAIIGLGDIERDNREENIHLKNLNLAYEQVRPEGEDGFCVDNLQVQVPLLSIVPITSLNVEKAKIDFSAEVRTVKDENGDGQILARICSPEQRESDNLPRVSYQLEIGSIAATEGVLRITDMLSSNQVAKKLDSTPVTADGNLGSEKHKNVKEEIDTRKAKIKKLKSLSQRVSDMLDEQERVQQVSKGIYSEGASENGMDLDRDKYQVAQANIEKQILEHQEKIMDLEIQMGLENDCG